MSHVVSAEVTDFLYLWPGGAEGPADPTHFGVTVHVLISDGPTNPADSFDITLCTPFWFAEELTAGRWQHLARPRLDDMDGTVLPGCGVWFVPRWDQEAFERLVHSVCAEASPAPDWGTVASRIGRFIPWEFDYRYDAFVDGHYGQPFPPSTPAGGPGSG